MISLHVYEIISSSSYLLAVGEPSILKFVANTALHHAHQAMYKEAYQSIEMMLAVCIQVSREGNIPDDLSK